MSSPSFDKRRADLMTMEADLAGINKRRQQRQNALIGQVQCLLPNNSFQDEDNNVSVSIPDHNREKWMELVNDIDEFFHKRFGRAVASCAILDECTSKSCQASDSAPTTDLSIDPIIVKTSISSPKSPFSLQDHLPQQRLEAESTKDSSCCVLEKVTMHSNTPHFIESRSSIESATIPTNEIETKTSASPPSTTGGTRGLVHEAAQTLASLSSVNVMAPSTPTLIPQAALPEECEENDDVFCQLLNNESDHLSASAYVVSTCNKNHQKVSNQNDCDDAPAKHRTQNEGGENEGEDMDSGSYDEHLSYTDDDDEEFFVNEVEHEDRHEDKEDQEEEEEEEEEADDDDDGDENEEEDEDEDEGEGEEHTEEVVGVPHIVEFKKRQARLERQDIADDDEDNVPGGKDNSQDFSRHSSHDRSNIVDSSAEWVDLF